MQDIASETKHAKTICVKLPMYQCTQIMPNYSHLLNTTKQNKTP